MEDANPVNIASLPNIYTYPATFHLLTYVGITGDPSNIGLGQFPPATPAYQGYVTNNTATLTFDLVVTGGPVAVGPPAAPTGLTGAASGGGAGGSELGCVLCRL